MSAPQTNALHDDAPALLALLQEVLARDDEDIAAMEADGIDTPAGGYALTERIRAMVAKHAGSAA